MNTIIIKDTVAFRRGVLEYSLALAATAMGSVTVSSDGPLQFPITVNDVELEAWVAHVDPEPHADSYIKAQVMLAVLVPEAHRETVNAPEHYYMDEPVHCVVQITADHVGGEYRAYDYDVADSVLRQ